MELDFGGFAVAGFDGVYDAAAGVWGEGEAVGEDEDGLGEVEFEERLGGGELDDLAGLVGGELGGGLLVEAVVAAAAKLDKAVAEGFGEGGGGGVWGFG